MIGVLVRAVTILNEVEKVRDLLKTKATYDALWKDKKLIASPQFNYKVEFFYSYEPTNYIADLSNNMPNEAFAVCTGNIYRSEYDNQLYLQAKLTRKIKAGNFSGDWDDEIVFVRALDVLTVVSKSTATTKNNTGKYILMLAAAYLLLNQK